MDIAEIALIMEAMENDFNRPDAVVFNDQGRVAFLEIGGREGGAHHKFFIVDPRLIATEGSVAVAFTGGFQIDEKKVKSPSDVRSMLESAFAEFRAYPEKHVLHLQEPLMTFPEASPLE